MQFARFGGWQVTQRWMSLSALVALLLVSARPGRARADAASSNAAATLRGATNQGERPALDSGRFKTRLSLAGSWMKVAYWGLRVRGAGATRATQTAYAVAVKRHLELLDHLATLTSAPAGEGEAAPAAAEPKRSRILARQARGFAKRAETWLSSLEKSVAEAGKANDLEAATRMARGLACMVELHAYLGDRDARLVCGEEGGTGEGAEGTGTSAQRPTREQLARRLSELAERTRAEGEGPAWEPGARGELLRAAELVLGAEEGSDELKASLGARRSELAEQHEAKLKVALGTVRQRAIGGLVAFELLSSASEEQLRELLVQSELPTDDAGRAAIIKKIMEIRTNGKLAELRPAYLKRLSAYSDNAEAYGGQSIKTEATFSEDADNVAAGAGMALDVVIRQLARRFAVERGSPKFRTAALAALQTKGSMAVVESVNKALAPYENRAKQDLDGLADPGVPLVWLDRPGQSAAGDAFVTRFKEDTTAVLAKLGLGAQAASTTTATSDDDVPF